MPTPARPVELGLAVLWFLVTFTVFQKDEYLLYPLALYFSYAVWRDRRATAPILVGSWPLLLLPVWAILSSPMGVVPDEAFRTGVQMLLSGLICVLFAAWMSPRRIVLTAFFATGVCGVLSIFFTSYHDGAMTGIFAHKNMLGAKMLLLWAAALCVAFDPWFRLWLRGAALMLAALAFMLILRSHSATALVLSLAIIAMIGGFSFFAGDGRRTPADRIAAGLITIGVLAIALPALLSGPDTLVDAFFDRLGKSRTLTGRTQLWAYAEGVIRQHPVTGYGGGGFWRYQENDLVRQIFAKFHKSPNQVFSFHNSFYENTVHFGLIGLVLTVWTLVWAFGRLAAQLLQHGGMPFIFFLAVAGVELIRAMVESELMRPFVLAHMLIWIGACFLSKHRQNSRPMPLMQPPDPQKPAAALRVETP
ncbi:hypothetical protein AB838_16130 [Rhodobacteraceae bacterium (ex Bugula neritina AB1)]|nr:hypothetical protein AB838_16130 [Rhodobacteraceae bacterium (ex Bugula neritina AB1)]